MWPETKKQYFWPYDLTTVNYCFRIKFHRVNCQKHLEEVGDVPVNGTYVLDVLAKGSRSRVYFTAGSVLSFYTVLLFLNID